MADNEPDFEGVIGRTVDESKPFWPYPKRPPEGSPNVVCIVLDDTGFSDFGCYGSEIDTPNFNRLAAEGLLYNNFHTTALCSPTRACLLTGRNHHSVGVRTIADADVGFPHARAQITKSAATVAEMLREAGYNTMATGKWHLVPPDEVSGAGPYDQWPTGRGFERYYGFLYGATNQYYPDLHYDNHPVDPPRTPEEGYHVTEDIVDMSVRFVRDQKSSQPEKPFFLYMCFGATHWPLHAPKEFIDKYRGRFDQGWDVIREERLARQKELGIVPQDCELAPPNEDAPSWDSLSEDEKKVCLRYQEAYAGMLDHTDDHVGRFLDFLKDIGQLDNTLIFLLSDNGASPEGGPLGRDGIVKAKDHISEQRLGAADSAEESLARIDEIGGPTSVPVYPIAWGQASNTPLKRYKLFTHGGGVRDPLIVHWPAGVKERGQIRRQFHHVSDIVPTILDVLNMDAPEVYNGIAQKPIEGTSLAYTFDAACAEEPTRKEVQYFEMWGHRGIWHKGWKAVAHHRIGDDFMNDDWELYNLEEDFSECHNLADKHPQKLREMIERWWAEAGKYNVLPLDDRLSKIFDNSNKPGTPNSRTHFEYFPPVSRISGGIAPRLGNRSWTLNVEVERPDAATEGVLVAIGGSTGGISFYVQEGHLVFDLNMYGNHYRAVSKPDVPVGRSTLGVRFEKIIEGKQATMLINGESAGTVQIPGIARAGGGIEIGRDAFFPVTRDYASPFPFGGKIYRVVFDIDELPTP